MTTVPEAFDQVMRQLGVSGKSLAETSGCSPGHVSQFRNGGEVTIGMLTRLLEGGEACAPGFKSRFISLWLGAQIGDAEQAIAVLASAQLTDDQVSRALMALSAQFKSTRAANSRNNVPATAA